MGAGGAGPPTYLQWGLACVRSRAFVVGKEAFGCVPFLDAANHAADPNADHRRAAAAAAAAAASAVARALPSRALPPRAGGPSPLFRVWIAPSSPSETSPSEPSALK